MYKNLTALSVMAGVLVIQGCSWVDLDPNAQDVLVLKPDQIKQCEQMRKTTSQVMDKVGFMNRNKKKMAKELATLARNTAAELGGNAIVADSDIENGKQTFIILNCEHLR